MTLKFVQATNEDILSIQPQIQQADSTSLQLGREMLLQNLVPLTDQAIAVRSRGLCLGAYGWFFSCPGMARAWALFSDSLLKEHSRALARHVKRDLEHWLTLYEWHRLEATVSVQHASGVAFLSWLGFQREGLMRCYGPAAEDSWLFARIHDVA